MKAGPVDHVPAGERMKGTTVDVAEPEVNACGCSFTTSKREPEMLYIEPGALVVEEKMLPVPRLRCSVA